MGSYPTLSPLPAEAGGLLSVALSLRSPSPDVIRHRVSVEPGLSSPYRLSALVKRGCPANWHGSLSGDAKRMPLKYLRALRVLATGAPPRPDACLAEDRRQLPAEVLGAEPALRHDDRAQSAELIR